MNDVRYSWTQPICHGCYDDRYPGRGPMALIQTEEETCVDCGERTSDGIYIRTDPAMAAHPTMEK